MTEKNNVPQDRMEQLIGQAVETIRQTPVPPMPPAVQAVAVAKMRQAARKPRLVLLYERIRAMKPRNKFVAAASFLIALALAVALTNYSAKPANASEQFQQMLEANKGYKGWLHVKAIANLGSSGATTGPATQRTVHAEVFFNTVDSTYVTITDKSGYRVVDLVSPVRGEATHYSSASNMVSVTAISKTDAMKMIDQGMAATTASGLIEVLRGKNENIQVSERMVDDLVEFTVVFPPSNVFERAILAVDPRTRLIQRLSVEIIHGSADYTYEYNVSPIKDIYDVNVPRDAVVVAPVASSIPANGVQAPLFEAKGVDGSTIRLQDYRGKLVLLDFWATWCGPCKEEIPTLKAVHDAFGRNGKLVIISLSLDKDINTLKDYTTQNKMDWVHGFLGDWSEATLPNQYGVKGIPAIFLIGPDGKVVARDLRGENIRFAVEQTLQQTDNAAEPRDTQGKTKDVTGAK